MEHAKKMVIVPQEFIERMKNIDTNSIKTPRPSGTLDSEMLKLLNNKDLDDSEKWKQYQQVLQRYLHFASQKRKPIQLSIIDSGESDLKTSGTIDIEEIVDSFPKSYKSDARNLLRSMERRSDLITWDKNGTVFVKNDKIPHSNIIDITHDIVRSRKPVQPTGWDQVMQVLRDINIPTQYIGNTFTRKYLLRLKELGARSPSLEESFEIKKKIESDIPASDPANLIESLYTWPRNTGLETSTPRSTGAIPKRAASFIRTDPRTSRKKPFTWESFRV